MFAFAPAGVGPLVAVVLALAPSAAFAASMTFDFTFRNVLYDGALISGTVSGLSEGTGPASSLRITESTGGLGIGEFVGSPENNSWTVKNGRITAFDFLVFGQNNSVPEVTGQSLFLDSAETFGGSFRAALGDRDSNVRTADSRFGTDDFGLTFTLRREGDPIDFLFAFDNVLYGGGTVTGVVRGLYEGTGPAASVEILESPGGFAFGEFIGNPANNIWTVTDGQVTAFDFLVFGGNNSAPEVTGASLFLDSAETFGGSFRAALGDRDFTIRSADSRFGTDDFGLAFKRVEAPAAIPLPAAGWLLLGGLAALAGLGARRPRLG